MTGPMRVPQLLIAIGVLIGLTACSTSSDATDGGSIPTPSIPQLTSGYGYQQGTSMATPYAVGVAAMIQSENPSFTATDVLEEMLTKAAWATEFTDNEYGFGIACTDKIMGLTTVCGEAPSGTVSSGPQRTVESVLGRCDAWMASNPFTTEAASHLISKAEGGDLKLADERLIVHFDRSQAPRLTTQDEFLRPQQLSALNQKHGITSQWLTNDTIVVTSLSADPWQTARNLLDDPSIDYVQPNLLYEPMANERLDDQWAITDFGVPSTWAALEVKPGLGVDIAVIDSSFYVEHEDLVGRFSTNQWDFYAGDSDVSVPANTEGSLWQHGTHVAGIIASADNNVGIRGVASSATLIPAKVFNNKGDTSDSITLIQAIQWVSGESLSPSENPHPEPLSTPVDFINLSLGFDDPQTTSAAYDLALHEAIGRAWENGIVTFAAVGNITKENPDPSSGVLPPANGPCTIAVGSVDHGYNRSAFSRYATGFEVLVDIMAPGGTYTDVEPPGILSTVPVVVSPAQLPLQDSTLETRPSPSLPLR